METTKTTHATLTSKTYAAIIAIALVVGVASFYGGVAYGKTHAAARGGVTLRNGTGGTFNGMMLNGRTGQGTNTGRGGFGGMTIGEILKTDASGITVKLPNGGSRLVITTASTTVFKSTPAQSADLTVGATITVQGTATSDGSITAQSIQIRPAGSLPTINR